MFYFSIDFYELEGELKQIGYFCKSLLGIELTLSFSLVQPFIGQCEFLHQTRQMMNKFGKDVVYSLIKLKLQQYLMSGEKLEYILPKDGGSGARSKEGSTFVLNSSLGRGRKRKRNEIDFNYMDELFPETTTNIEAATTNMNEEDDDVDDDADNLAEDDCLTAELVDHQTIQPELFKETTQLNSIEDTSILDYKVLFPYTKNDTKNFLLLASLLDDCKVYINERELNEKEMGCNQTENLG